MALIVLLRIRDQLRLRQVLNAILPFEIELDGCLAELSLLNTLVL